MKKILIPALLLGAAMSIGLPSCDDDANNIGGSIAKGEVTIIVDSTFTVTGRCVRNEQIDSRNEDLLIGRLYVEDYGELNASFAGRLMPASTLAIPDSIPLDDISGMSLRFSFKTDGFTGDTLAPQQLSVYSLTKQLPSGIDNTFNPDGYYDESSPLGSASYTASTLGLNASKDKVGYVSVPLDKSFARKIVEQYRKDPAVFQWPETFAKYFPGIYVKSTFGRGLVLNFTNTEFLTFWTRKIKVNKIENGVGVVRDSLLTDTTSLFAISPEVLSANLLRFTPAESIKERVNRGEYVIQSPAGYNIEIDFPAQSIIDRYASDNFNLAVINSLTFSLPVTTPSNTYGITPPPYMLMIKTSKMKDFFIQNKVPTNDDTDVFWASYNSETGEYVFNNMRPYLMALIKSGGKVSDEDSKFTIVPVNITTENTGYTGNQKTVVTKCEQYIAHPSLCIADLSRSKVKFTYSRQVIR
ncbi:MAG: DUF4270 domain-containing protein [Prevotella sp.]|nr:DUF4270 domain-containing protein [Prevotella sp.]MCM1075623.1 DUF4270 domain-containing protein [Ruminococcus sp.]